MERFVSILGVVFSGGLIVIVVMAMLALVAAIPVYFLWNWLIPTIFGLKTITFWQAWGLFWLTSILFKGGGSSSSSN